MYFTLKKYGEFVNDLLNLPHGITAIQDSLDENIIKFIPNELSMKIDCYLKRLSNDSNNIFIPDNKYIKEFDLFKTVLSDNEIYSLFIKLTNDRELEICFDKEENTFSIFVMEKIRFFPINGVFDGLFNFNSEQFNKLEFECLIYSIFEDFKKLIINFENLKLKHLLNIDKFNESNLSDIYYFLFQNNTDTMSKILNSFFRFNNDSFRRFFTDKYFSLDFKLPGKDGVLRFALKKTLDYISDNKNICLIVESEYKNLLNKNIENETYFFEKDINGINHAIIKRNNENTIKYYKFTDVPGRNEHFLGKFTDEELKTKFGFDATKIF